MKIYIYYHLYIMLYLYIIFEISKMYFVIHIAGNIGINRNIYHIIEFHLDGSKDEFIWEWYFKWFTAHLYYKIHLHMY